MQFQPPGEDYQDYASEPCEWQLIPGVRPEIINARCLDYSAAIHEAGHAVLSEHFGYRVASVTIQGTTGVTETEPTDKNPEHVIVIAHAGYVAAIQTVCKRYAFSTANHDGLMIWSVRNKEKYTIKHMGQLRQQCLDLVEQNWIQIQKVADVLATKEVLTGEEVGAIVQEAIRENS
jgi:hypothetical protein